MHARKIFLITSLTLFLTASLSFAFPPQSVEFLPGYKFPDSSSYDSGAYQLRYFLYFPSMYLGAGVGISSIHAEANHQNLAVNSSITMQPLTFALKFIPPHSQSFIPYFEIGLDHLSKLHYQMDPSVDRGGTDTCITDPQLGPLPCKKTTFNQSHSAFHVGAGVETIFKSGFGLGAHYTYLVAKPLERTIQTNPALTVSQFSSETVSIFKINESILSLLVSYHF